MVSGCGYDEIGPFRLITQWRFKRGVEEQMKAFMDGFSEVVPLQWLQCFDERELEVRLVIKNILNIRLIIKNILNIMLVIKYIQFCL